MNSRELIRHPGDESKLRRVSAFGTVKTQKVTLPAGHILLSAVSEIMDSIEGDSAILVLDGATLGPFNYVMPDISQDDLHAAWYSKTHTCDFAQLHNATAIVGKRDRQWWLHCHALWQSKEHASNTTIGMGHLLPDQVTIYEDIEITLYEFDGGYFDVEEDPETAFPIFHVHGGKKSGNAFIAKVNPHEDIFTAIERFLIDSHFTSASILGIGSLIGARFKNDPPMLCPISEVLIGSNATWINQTLNLPIHCVDIDGNIFRGNVVEGGAPVLVTFELLVIED